MEKRWRLSRKSKRDCKLAKNEYTRIKTDEEQKHEGIINKCGKQPKLLYRLINKKLKQRESTVRLPDNNSIYERPNEMSRLLSIISAKGFFSS